MIGNTIKTPAVIHICTESHRLILKIIIDGYWHLMKKGKWNVRFLQGTDGRTVVKTEIDIEMINNYMTYGLTYYRDLILAELNAPDYGNRQKRRN